MQKKKQIKEKLAGGDLRSIGLSNDVVSEVLASPDLLIDLKEGLEDQDRVIRMRCADVLEKISREKPEWLYDFKDLFLKLAIKNKEKELQWHLPVLLRRQLWVESDCIQLLEILLPIHENSKSRIARVESLETLVSLAADHKTLQKKVLEIFINALHSTIPSISARARNLPKKYPWLDEI